MGRQEQFHIKTANIILDQRPRYFSTKTLERKRTTLTTRRHNHRCTLIYKCMKGLIDFDFELAKNEDIYEHNKRHCRDLHLPRAKTNKEGLKGKQRPMHQASIDFKNLEHDVKILLHYITLKKNY